MLKIHRSAYRVPRKLHLTRNAVRCTRNDEIKVMHCQSFKLKLQHLKSQLIGFDRLFEKAKDIKDFKEVKNFIKKLEQEKVELDNQIDQAFVAQNKYHVFVDYEMPHDKKTLEKEFPAFVSDLFYDKRFVWKLDKSCEGIDQAHGKRIMLLKDFKRDITSQDAIGEMAELGYRPATHLEAYAFNKSNPEIQKKFVIVALGSSTGSIVAVLGNTMGMRVLIGDWITNTWSSYHRLLFVRKP
jgi:hypothetical protein